MLLASLFGVCVPISSVSNEAVVGVVGVSDSSVDVTRKAGLGDVSSIRFAEDAATGSGTCRFVVSSAQVGIPPPIAAVTSAEVSKWRILNERMTESLMISQ